MDKLKTYQNVIEKVLTEYAAIPFAYGNLEAKTIFDRINNRYLLMTVGWKNGNRIHGCLVHIDIINNKIYIQRDGTEEGIALDLERENIPKSDIVLAFHLPELRKYTEYAVA